MSFRTWFADLQLARNADRLKRGWRRSPRRRQTSSFCLAAEVLEVRQLLSAITVVNTSDSGAGSLRAAIAQVNADTQPGTDTINFAIGTGAQSIALQSALPNLTHSVVIDGTSQPGFAGKPLIELDGTVAGSSSGLTIDAGSSTVKDLVINRFLGGGIVLEAQGGDTLTGNYIGTDVTGTLARPNSVAGVLITSTGNTIGGTAPGEGNLLSGNFGDGEIWMRNSGNNLVEGNFIGTDVTGTKTVTSNFGIFVQGGSGANVIGGTEAGARNIISNNNSGIEFSTIGYAATSNTGNVVEGNYIGTDVTGTKALGNTDAGVVVASNFNTIGGTTAGAGNVISGNKGPGLWTGGSGNLVEGNYIGTDVTGTKALGNGIEGIFAVGGSSNTIGGTTAGARNVISGNMGPGLMFDGSGNLVGYLVEGNYIGTDVTGTKALGNGGDGIFTSIPSTVIGGTTPGAGNIISGNMANGVDIQANGALVQGNFIGTDVTGTKALGNGTGTSGWGVFLKFSSGATIGGTTPGAGNIIAFNKSGGVQVSNNTGNEIEQNSIFANGGPGISAPANAPVLTSAISSNGNLVIDGTLTGTARTTYTLEFFSNPDATNGGKTYLGSITVTTDVTGKASFQASFAVTVGGGQFISATATDPFHTTSRFSNRRRNQ